MNILVIAKCPVARMKRERHAGFEARCHAVVGDKPGFRCAPSGLRAASLRSQCRCSFAL